MISRIVLAVIVGVVVYLVCVFVGGLLAAMGVPIAAFVGGFLVQYAALLSVLAALWYFFAGGGLALPRFR